MSLDGPSRTIRVEPLKVPVAPAQPRRADPPPAPASPPEKQPAVPAG